MTVAPGFIGLGTMGRAMATCLLNSGQELRVWNRSAAAIDPLIERGAVRADSLADAAGTGVFFSMLANDQAAEETFTAEALAQVPAGSLHICHSTLSIAATDRLTEMHRNAGIDYVAAPVLGRATFAEQGTVNIVAAGATAAITRARPYLDILGKRTWVVGENPSTASLVKIGVNYNLIHALQALAESITLVEQGGVAAEEFVEILTDAAFTGSAYTGYGALIARKAYSPPGFTVALGLKDLALTEQAAEAHGVTLSTAPVLRRMFESALADPNLADLDWSAIAEVTRGLVDET